MNLLEQRQIYLYNFINRLYFNIGQTRPNIINETEFYIQSYYNQHVKNPSQIEINQMQQNYMDIFNKFTPVFANRKIKVNQCFQSIILNYEYIPSLSSYDQNLFELNKLYLCINKFNNIKLPKKNIQIPQTTIIIQKPNNLNYNPFLIDYNWNILSENFTNGVNSNSSINNSSINNSSINNCLNNSKVLISNNIIFIIIVILFIILLYTKK